MPRYDVTLVRTLTLTTSVSVRATSEDEAEEKVHKMIAQGDFGGMTWEIEEAKKDCDTWGDEADEITIDSVQEE